MTDEKLYDMLDVQERKIEALEEERDAALKRVEELEGDNAALRAQIEALESATAAATSARVEVLERALRLAKVALEHEERMSGGFETEAELIAARHTADTKRRAAILEAMVALNDPDTRLALSGSLKP